VTAPPPPITGAAAWRGEELFARADWRVDLGGLAGPARTARLLEVQHQLEVGSGAALVRGLQVDGVSDGELGARFTRLASQVGTPVSQSAAGEVLLRVEDQRFGPDDPRFRGPHSNRRLSFHTDRCDVIAFLCVRPAASGGDTELVSSAALFNEMRRRAPAELQTLHDGYPYLRHTVDAGNPRPYTHVPVFSNWQGHFAASYLRVLIDRADQSPDAPSLTAAQRRALDVLDEVAQTPELIARFRLEAGDVLLLNNWVALHRRTAFVDHESAERRRLLLRLWLSVPNSRPLDPRFEDHFGATAAGALRGGMRPR